MEKYPLEPIFSEELKYSLEPDNLKTNTEKFLMVYHLRDSILTDLLDTDPPLELIKEKIEVLKTLPIPDNLALIPLTQNQMANIVKASNHQLRAKSG